MIMSQASMIADRTPEAAGDASNAQETASGERCTTRFDLIRSEERADAFQQFAEWVSSYPGCPYGASARALLQKWAKREA